MAHLVDWFATEPLNHPPVPTVPPGQGEAEREASPATINAQLVVRAQDGDLDAFEELVTRHQTGVYQFVLRLLRDPGDAEDVVQDVFVLVWRKLPELSDPVAFPRWLYRVAHRRATSVLRVRANRRTDVTPTGEVGDHAPDPQPLGAAGGPDPAQHAELTAQQEDLEDRLGALPQELRVCWVLKELNEMSYPDISAVLALPVSTVRGRIARARRQLAEGMASWR